MSYYGSLCTQLYDLDKPFAPLEELDFYLSYINGQSIKVLEPMCGSGRFLVPFLERGIKIDGFDISKDMLTACWNKMNAKNLKTNVFQSSIEEYNPKEKYDLIMMPGGSFTVLIEDNTVKLSLQKLKESLKQDGVLLIEALTPVAKCGNNDNWQESNRKTRSDGKVIVESCKSRYDDLHKAICFPLKYELYDDRELIQAESMDLYIRLYEIEELITLVKCIGFHTVIPVKAFKRGEEPSSEDEVFILECRLQA